MLTVRHHHPPRQPHRERLHRTDPADPLSHRNPASSERPGDVTEVQSTGRAVVHQGRIWSRHHRELTRYFPALAAVLPGGLVLDGEVVCWDHAASRLDFAALSRRLTAGRGLARWGRRVPKAA
jgi:hypothetical protein